MKFENGILTSWDKPFKIDLIPKSNTTSRPQYNLNPKGLTIHNTGNEGASAEANSEYVDTAKGCVSWHFTIGNGIVIQELPINEVAWHAGDGSKGYGNRNTLGLEIAEVDGAYETAIAFIKDLNECLGFGLEVIEPHKTWSGKNCPRLILPKWDEFMQDISPTPIDPKDIVSDWAVRGQAYCMNNGISDGLRPKDHVTREELWTIIERMAHNE